MSFFNPPKPYALRVRNEILDLQRPRIMGILNLTPDSFYAESRVEIEPAILKSAEGMLLEGADFLDLGAASSRPGSALPGVKVEWERLGPALKSIKAHFPQALISVDTFRAEIAHRALEEGADLINDISGGLFDPEMLSTLGKARKPLILMHVKGDFETMHQPYDYQNIKVEVALDLQNKIQLAKEAGVRDFIIDPGFGFSKKGKQNYELLAGLDHLQCLEAPVLVGISRKSMVYKALNSSPEDALNGTTALHMVALQKGAQILRVHDVKAARECINLYLQLCLQE